MRQLFATLGPYYSAPLLLGSRTALQAEIAPEHHFVQAREAAAEAATALAFQQTTAVAWRGLMGASGGSLELFNFGASPAAQTQRAIPSEQSQTSPASAISTRASLSGLWTLTPVTSITVPGTGVTLQFPPAPIPTASNRVQQQRDRQSEAFFTAHPEFANISPTDTDAIQRRSVAFRSFLASRPDLTGPLGIEVPPTSP